MARGMWLEHPEAQEQAIGQAHALRELAATKPEGPERDVLEDTAAFLGAITDADSPPRTEQEMRDAAAWRAANPQEVERRRRRMMNYASALEWADAAMAERDAPDARTSDAAE